MPSLSTKSPRPGLPPAERLLLGVVSFHLCWLPWALGGMRAWAHPISAALGACSLALALLAHPTRRILRFPIFWLGLLFLGYVAAGGLNPAWRFASTPFVRWVEPIPHIAWLPSGVSAPYVMGNPWTTLLIAGAAWSTVCAIHVGFTTRQTLRRLFTVLVANGVLLSVIGLAEKATHTGKILWFYTPPASYFGATIVYKNHAGAYFNLVLGVCAGMAAWHRREGIRRLAHAANAGLFLPGAGVLMLMVLLTISKASIVLMAGFVALALLVVFRQGLVRPRGPAMAVAGLLALVVVAWLGTVSLPELGGGSLVTRLKDEAVQLRSPKPGVRQMASRATIELFESSPVFGCGGNGFRYLFPAFQKHYPALCHESGGFNRYLYFEFAHDDYAQMLAEYGLVGSGILAALFAAAAWPLCRRRVWENPCLALVLITCALALVHAAGDFIFHCPAVLLTWCALVTAAGRWSDFQRASGPARR